MKDFTLYPEALDLNKLGFNEPCLAFYNGTFLDSTQYRFYDCSMMDIGQCFLAPTYSQAFRWFRKEYALESYIRANLCVDVPKTYQFNIDDNIDDVWYDTYEEAELACLKKLIEIVKEGDKL
jgi:hypothetical protein